MNQRPTFSEVVKGATRVNEDTYVREVPIGYRIYKGESETAYTSKIITHEQFEAIKTFWDRTLQTV